MGNPLPTGFKDLLNAMMKRRWYITALVLGGFMLIIAGIFVSIIGGTAIKGEWKELLLLLIDTRLIFLFNFFSISLVNLFLSE